MLPPRKPKAAKRETRWRSQAHLGFVRNHCCSVCHTDTAIEAAHVRLGSGAGMGQKPDDFRAVSLCGGPNGCHTKQHRIGEETFWQQAGQDVEILIDAFCRTSPKASEIKRIRQGMTDG